MKRIPLLVILLLACLFTGAGQSSRYLPDSVTVTIASGGTLSAAVDMGACTPIRITMPAAWTAANITFQASDDGTTFGNFRDQYGTEITAVVYAAGDVIQLDPATFNNLRWLKFRSGISGTTVAQGAARTLKVACKTF